MVRVPNGLGRGQLLSEFVTVILSAQQRVYRDLGWVRGSSVFSALLQVQVHALGSDGLAEVLAFHDQLSRVKLRHLHFGRELCRCLGVSEGINCVEVGLFNLDADVAAIGLRSLSVRRISDALRTMLKLLEV